MESMVKKGRKMTLADSDTLTRHLIRYPNGTSDMVKEVGRVRRMHVFMKHMQEAVESVAKGGDDPFSNHIVGGQVVRRLTPQGRAFWRSVVHADSELLELCEGRRLNPWLRLGVHVARKWGPRLRGYTTHADTDALLLPGLPELLARQFRLIRYVVSRKAFQDEVKGLTRVARDMYASCAELMLKVLAVHSRLLSMRIDLYFEADAKLISESKAARLAIDKFVRELGRDNIIDDVLAYIVVREDGLDRCIHYHVWVAVDGHKHRDGFHLTEKLGKYWIDRCIGSPVLGSTKNCWERRAEYEHNSLGLLGPGDEEMLRGLRKAIAYMCKLGKMPHLYVKKNMGRNLRKSQPPRGQRGNPKRGAPRKAGNDVSVARRVLLGDLAALKHARREAELLPQDRQAAGVGAKAAYCG